MNKFIFLSLLFSSSIVAKPTPPKPEAAKLRYSFEFLLEKVLEKKRHAFRPEVPLPSLHLESQTRLNFFQDAIEAQWGMRPEYFTNAFSINHNMIFLTDDASYYERTGRCMDDSYVHELVHYIQAKYQNWDFNDESLEWEAVDIQTEFRNEFCNP
jgi:hypothetical protein